MDQALTQVDSILADSARSVPVMQETNETSRHRIRAQQHRIAPRLRPGQELLFRALWRLDIPVVVEGLHELTQGAWTPESFIRTHGAHPVTMLKSHSLPSERLSLARFFEEFAKEDAARGYAVKLKVCGQAY